MQEIVVDLICICVCMWCQLPYFQGSCGSFVV